MPKQIPEFLQKMLEKQYGQELTQKILEGYSKQRPVTLRVNTIKSNIEKIKTELYEGFFVAKIKKR